MKAQQQLVDTIANNIANVNTTGFKKNLLNFRSMLYKTVRAPGTPTAAQQISPTGLQYGSGVEISSSLKVAAQGELEPTQNPLDLAIQGEGYFKINRGDGTFFFTRDGSFRRDGQGDLVTVDGFRVEPSINIPQDALDVSVAGDGSVFVSLPGQAQPSQIGQLLVSRFTNPAGLNAEGANMYSETVSSGPPTDQVPGQTGSGFVRQNFLERSNVAAVDELIALIQAQRNYEVNSRTIRVSDEMMQEVGNLVR